MVQTCLVSKSLTPYVKRIQQILKDFEIEIITFQNEEELSEYESVSLVFWNGDEHLIKAIEEKLCNVFIIWIHPSSQSGFFASNYAYSAKTISAALQFLETAVTNNVSQEFNKLVNLKKRIHNDDIKAQENNFNQNEDENNLITERTEIQYTENPYYIRSRNLQKSLFARQKVDGHKTIGIWSPMPCRGVTTFILNFAFYLANNYVFTAVLEGLTANYELKTWLQRYTKIPEGWVSFAKALHSDNITKQVDWTYRNVKFLPLDNGDAKLNWNTQSLEAYMTTPGLVDVTLVDLPSGKMKNYTFHSLTFLDELWVMVDDVIHQVLSWKNYLQEIKKRINIPMYLLYNKVNEFSMTKYVAEQLDIPLLAELPDLHKECLRNNYETIPVYFHQEVKEKLDKVFLDLAKHVVGENFEPSNASLREKKKESWFASFRTNNKVKNIFSNVKWKEINNVRDS